MLDVVGNPEDRFSGVAAHLRYKNSKAGDQFKHPYRQIIVFLFITSVM